MESDWLEISHKLETSEVGNFVSLPNFFDNASYHAKCILPVIRILVACKKYVHM